MSKKTMFIIFQPLDNEEVQETISSWISKAGGSLPLKELEKKAYEKFHFFYPQFYKEKDMSGEIESWRKFAFKLKDDLVYKT